MSVFKAGVDLNGSFGDGYAAGAQTASELSEIDDFLENTESEYISDSDDIDTLEGVGELRQALRNKEKHIKSLRYAHPRTWPP